MKILKYYNSTILYKSPKNPIFVQLSPIQCTYSNIFIRFFKFSPANTNIYQNSYSVIRRAVRLTPGCPVITMRSPYFIRYEVLNVIARSCLLWKPLQKRLKCLCGIQNKPNKHYTVLKLIIFIHTQLNSGHRKISP